MTKQNKNRREQETPEQMAASGNQIVMMGEDGSEQPIEEIIESQPGLCDYPFDKDFHYENWWCRRNLKVHQKRNYRLHHSED